LLKPILYNQHIAKLPALSNMPLSESNIYPSKNGGISPPNEAAEWPRSGVYPDDYRSVSPLSVRDDRHSAAPKAKPKQKKKKEDKLEMSANFANLNGSPSDWMLPPSQM
jgi:hypothetical protein